MLTKPMTDPNITIKTPRDPNTLSNYHNFVTRHTSVDFDIDFDKKRLYGSVTLTLESLTDEDVKEIVLDSRYVKSEEKQRGPGDGISKPLNIMKFFGWLKRHLIQLS